MLLAIDIGNTNISLGIFKGKRLIRRYAIATGARNYLPLLRKICVRYKIDKAIICSVVPLASRRINSALRHLGCRPCHIGKELRVPMKSRYRRPSQLGQDRLVNAFAGAELYGAPLVIVDFGTGITFDVVSRSREYLGGMILPGLELSLEALYQGAALLPKVKLARPSEFIGRDTPNSMLSGIVYGFAALSDQLTASLKQKIGKGAKVVGTGGNIGLIRGYCRNFDYIDRDLTLKGLNLIYKVIYKIV
jgi:type III pantothenate kinase